MSRRQFSDAEIVGLFDELKAAIAKVADLHPLTPERFTAQVADDLWTEGGEVAAVAEVFTRVNVAAEGNWERVSEILARHS